MTVSTRLASSLILTALFTSQYAFAEAKNNLNQPVKLNHATVFLYGAELDNDVTLSLNKGQNKVILTNIAHNVDPRTLSVNLNDKNVIIRSVNIQTVPTEVVYPENIKALQTQQKQLMQQIEDAIIAIKVGEEQLSLLKDQRFFGENNAQSLEQSSQKLDFIRQQMTKILQEQQKYQLTIDELEEKSALLQAQIDQNMPASLGKQTQVVMSIDAPEATTAKLQLSYLTQDAAWSPSYDIRSQNTESPIVLTYKADVIQNTGIDWENIDLTLSTINPSKNITPFDLQPWRLSIYDENKQLERQVRMKPMPAAPVAMYEESMTASKKRLGQVLLIL
ncbi:mucoidy inhibitor MuiA family protein [Providencia rettgeri]|nr:mucoidy inhibitor MuiA family protein [Providencia rettgeri]